MEIIKLKNYVIIEPQLLASAYIPFQMSDFQNLYEPDEALSKGTIFPELFLPGLGLGGTHER